MPPELSSDHHHQMNKNKRKIRSTEKEDGGKRLEKTNSNSLCKEQFYSNAIVDCELISDETQINVLRAIQCC